MVLKGLQHGYGRLQLGCKGGGLQHGSYGAAAWLLRGMAAWLLRG